MIERITSKFSTLFPYLTSCILTANFRRLGISLHSEIHNASTVETINKLYGQFNTL